MEVHSSSSSSSSANSVMMGKRFWNFFRIAYFMMRKGLISKQKLIMDMNLMMKRGKILRKTLGNLMFHHHQSRNMATAHGAGGGFGLQEEYEFSCSSSSNSNSNSNSNSPNPVFFHMPVKRKQYHYFPCINPPNEEDLDQEIKEVDISKAVVLVPAANYKDIMTSTYSPPEYSACNFRFCSATTTPPDHLAPSAGGGLISPLLSPLSIRISNFSSSSSSSLEEEEDIIENDQVSKHNVVDDAAEDFIRRFYEQLRVQSRTQLLQYQEEVQYQEMLARGTR